jgi:hypothetical protein
MQPSQKFIHLVLPLAAGLMVLCLVFYYDKAQTLRGVEWLLVALAILLVVNLFVYRRHVKHNPWLGPETRIRMRKVVTKFGPLGQLAYYVSHIHPHNPDDPKPTEHNPDLPRTDADEMIGI